MSSKYDYGTRARTMTRTDRGPRQVRYYDTEFSILEVYWITLGSCTLLRKANNRVLVRQGRRREGAAWKGMDSRARCLSTERKYTGWVTRNGTIIYLLCILITYRYFYNDDCIFLRRNNDSTRIFCFEIIT